MLWEHRFYHVVIFQEWLWQQVFSLHSCANKFWLIFIRITKWDKMKQKSTINVSGNSTSICLMQWFVSNDSLTACTIYCSALLSQLGVRKVLQCGVGGWDLCRLHCKYQFLPAGTGQPSSKLSYHCPIFLPLDKIRVCSWLKSHKHNTAAELALSDWNPRYWEADL